MSLKTVLVTAGCASLLAPASALAQDYDWTGFYVGANAGASWGDTSIQSRVEPGGGAVVIPPVERDLINADASIDENDTGFTGGVQAGYNFQSGVWVFGLETDVGWMDIGQGRTKIYQSPLSITPTPITLTASQEVSTDWVWTLRPRIGYASGPYMVYGTAGLAASRISVDASFADSRIPPNAGNFSESDTKFGWTAGIGGAVAINQNWSVRGEWLYTDFGTVRNTWVTPNGYAAFTTEADTRANLLRIGVDYRF
jgi:outer membrane immunogenic protein